MKKLFFLFIFLILIIGCSEKAIEPIKSIDRLSKIPDYKEKITPEIDLYPPILHSDEYEPPVPLAVINSKGAEDSSFIPYNNEGIYFFFTPDVDVPVEKQVIDEVTGIYFSKNINGAFQEPIRVILQDKGNLSLDGCEFVTDNEIWVCSAREGYTGLHWVKAERSEEQWKNWQVKDFNPDYEVGELHIYQDELYFHSTKSGGQGSYDIWMSKMVDGEWAQPVNIDVVNSPDTDGWPYISQEGNELWFTRTYQGSPAIFRSKRVDQEWQEPEIIISQFAGESTLDKDGNLYFTHHFYNNSHMLEADIYIAYKK